MQPLSSYLLLPTPASLQPPGRIICESSFEAPLSAPEFSPPKRWHDSMSSMHPRCISHPDHLDATAHHFSSVIQDSLSYLLGSTPQLSWFT